MAAMAASVNILIASAPKTLPSAMSGASMMTALMLVISSGSDVATLTRMVPTQSAPQPVRSAISSPK